MIIIHHHEIETESFPMKMSHTFFQKVFEQFVWNLQKWWSDVRCD